MSAEFFYSEAERHNIDPNTKSENACSSDRSGKKSNDSRLQDIEEQLEMAESRCNNLKDQLDYMKQMYGGHKIITTKTRKISSAKTPKSSTARLDINSNDDIKTSFLLSPAGTRQKSNLIGTDNTGAAVRTINNILNGITNSVNRLSEIHSQITTPRVKALPAISPKPEDQNSDDSIEPNKADSQKTVIVVPELKFGSATDITSNTRGQKRKASKAIKTSSQYTIKRPSKVEKRTKTPAKSVVGFEKKSTTSIKNRIYSKFNSTRTNNLVEIYHNDAVKNCESDESGLRKSRQQQERLHPGGACGELKQLEEIPPLDVKSLNTLKENEMLIVKNHVSYPNGLNNRFPFDTQAPRTTVSCCYSKNYELPTVASRMKQVAKSYLGTLNLKTIPFCAAISTTQSHNIGINIQQVMNIIKNRQPINGISPTLAHNIGLAAEKLNSKPFSALVSTINSRISQVGSRCPLSRTYLNFQQLQEQAKNIPEEIIEEADEDTATAESPEMQTMIITGPSGDMEIKTKKVPTWREDKNSENAEQCTCVAQPNIGFQQIANKYHRNIRAITDNSCLTTQITDNSVKKRLRRYRSTRNTLVSKAPLLQETQVQTSSAANQEAENQKEITLNGRERNLKEVLTNLHHDFDYLNRKYEDLSQKSQSNDADECTIRELERLESELNKKEEEITMVMTLYKEVLALKQQVKHLREKRSQAGLPQKDSKDAKIKFKEYNNPEAAFHLTKLLKQIQHYQMRYKTNLSQE